MLRENRIIGAEALQNWQPGNGTSIQPSKFIPITEDTGLILPIGNWVLQQACLQNRLWHDAGLKLLIIINLSAMQFKRGNLVESVKSASWWKSRHCPVRRENGWIFTSLLTTMPVTLHFHYAMRRENTCPIASGDYSTPVSQRMKGGTCKRSWPLIIDRRAEISLTGALGYLPRIQRTNQAARLLKALCKPE